jgi:very-short-patch-repair endonuclease
LLEYYIKYESFIIPKCPVCGDNCRVRKGLVFRRTCGKTKCRSHKHSEQTKELIRKKVFEYLKKRTGKTAWERKNQGLMSNLEKWFVTEVIQKYCLPEKYDIVNEYSMFPYFIDFAFVNAKIAVELDGPVHFCNGRERLQHDLEKDKFLLSKGWKVIRIAYFETNEEKIKEFLELLDDLSKYQYNNQYNTKILNRTVYSYKEIRELKKQEEAKKREQRRRKRRADFLRIQLEKTRNVRNSSIDFSKFGWVKQVAETINLSPQKVNLWMKTYMKNFYKEKCFRRKKIL